MKFVPLFAFTFVLFSLPALAQIKGKTLQNSGKGQQNNNTGPGTQKVYNYKQIVVYKQIGTANKDKILLLNKYIDTTKEIRIRFGSGVYLTNIKELKKGIVPVAYDEKTIMKLIVKNRQLVFDCSAFTIDGTYIAKIENNKLLPTNEYNQYSSEKWIEVMSKHDIPVLQVELDKEDNSIKVSGLFFTDRGYMIMAKDGLILPGSFEVPFLQMTEQQRSSVLYDAIVKARKHLKTLHE